MRTNAFDPTGSNNDKMPQGKTGHLLYDVGDESELLKPVEYKIHESRDWWINVFFILLGVFVFLPLVISVGIKVYQSQQPDPEPQPAFTSYDILPGWKHEFFPVRVRLWKAVQICDSRGTIGLVVFNSSEENARFNKVVNDTFHAIYDNQTQNKYKRTGLQIWTGINMTFKAQTMPRMSYKGFMESPLPMQQFYIESYPKRLCEIDSSERFYAQMKETVSKYEVQHPIVKDYVSKSENSFNETGCWRVRIEDSRNKLELPFVCKGRVPSHNTDFGASNTISNSNNITSSTNTTNNTVLP